ncbi:uncharacterized protein K460DRAFT_278150 [Cucurbitaria berberidis CBS 394.84]|uniref:Uncharacterized protein n=1 Tax=Cucurbitaria berberidis CBS 394.84 TaxID=1168544 RepID=A0A9P4LBX5_9PLEO|nr:uncharacterized protein K460DRAFT_278150 [Cucurbitaria berberidis CBS 394.84]KAF1849083.1 hypothetical protein K460DRAFT_278150 [Cucurbitaria berberidis CBS 394.84]
MKTPFRIAHCMLVLILTALLLGTVFYGFWLLWDEQHPKPQVFDDSERKPSPQEIAESMNTLWDQWDEDHCKNVCEASWIACRLRHCDDRPDVRKQEL